MYKGVTFSELKTKFEKKLLGLLQMCKLYKIRAIEKFSKRHFSNNEEYIALFKIVIEIF